MLKQRALSSLWYALILIFTVWFGGELGLTILISVFGVLASLELYRLARAKASPLVYFGLSWTAFFIISRNSGILALAETRFNSEWLLPLLLSSAIILSLIGLLVRREKRDIFTSWSWTLLGVLYIGWLLSHLVAIRGLEDGRNWVFFVLFVTWVSDTAAYFIGRRFGRHKLAPTISPGKTWEGTVGGICGGILVSLVFFTFPPLMLPLAPWQAIILGAAVSVLGQTGDLVESLIKRNLGVKDSGTLMPGHGGILDRIDSLLFAAIVVYYYAAWVA